MYPSPELSCSSFRRLGVVVAAISVLTVHGQTSIKELDRVLPATSAHWVGNGFLVHPVFADLAFTNTLSPFLMLDYAAPKSFGPSLSERRGVGTHPHRGFETVTIAYQGEVEHADSQRNRDIIGPGDVQWMTAASGIIHEEYHSTAFTKRGGIFEMVQLWVNLPRVNKMTRPRYQPIVNASMPVVMLPANAGHVRVIAGLFSGKPGPAKTFSSMNLWDIELAKGKTATIDVPARHTTIVLVRQGTVLVGNRRLVSAQVATFSHGGASIAFKSDGQRVKMLVLTGEPLNEPIAAGGPFVMNTNEELEQANYDYHNGKFGDLSEL